MSASPAAGCQATLAVALAAAWAAGSQVLDLACGGGRHLRWLASRGCHVLGVDRDLSGLANVSGTVDLLQADLEDGPWPLAGRRFDAVVVTHYLWRPLMPTLLGSLAPGGVLIYETFAQGNETVGRPARPDFLLQHDELLRHCSGLRVVAYEDGFLPEPARFVQRIAAIRETGQPDGGLVRYALTDLP